MAWHFDNLRKYLKKYADDPLCNGSEGFDFITKLGDLIDSPGWVELHGFSCSINEILSADITIFFENDKRIFNFDRDHSFAKFLVRQILEDKMYTTANSTSEYVTNNYATTSYTCNYAYGKSETVKNDDNNKTEEKKDMNLIKGFEFGSCENDNVKVSLYGVAVKNNTGAWVSYDKESNSMVDVDILNFDAKYLYKMPVAIKDVQVGDTIVHNRVPMFVIKVEEARITAIDPKAGEEKTILPTKSMFGFDFITKIINIFDNFMTKASAETPFGNLIPLMMLSEGNEDMLPLMMMSSPALDMDMNNPMMLYLLTKDGNTSNIIPYIYLMNQKK